MFVKELEIDNLHFLSLFPENYSKYNPDNRCHEKPDGIVLWMSPIRQALFPEASFTLRNEGLGIFGRKVEVLGSWSWGAQ